MEHRKTLQRIMYISSLCLGIALAASGCGAPTTEVTVTLAESVEASQTEFEVGVPYEFVVTNNTGIALSWGVTPKVSISMPLSGGSATVSPETFESAVVVLDEIVPGKTATVKYTFKVEDAASANAAMYSRSASNVDFVGVSIVKADD